MKKIEKIFTELSQMIPEMKEDPKAWKKFLESFMKKRPNSQMSPAFQERLQERILKEIRLKDQKDIVAPPMIWGNWFKLAFGLAGGFAVLTLVGLPLIQNKPFHLMVNPAQSTSESFQNLKRSEPLNTNEKSQNNSPSTKQDTSKESSSSTPKNKGQSIQNPPQEITGSNPLDSQISPEYKGLDAGAWIMGSDGYYVPEGMGGGTSTEEIIDTGLGLGGGSVTDTELSTVQDPNLPTSSTNTQSAGFASPSNTQNDTSTTNNSNTRVPATTNDSTGAASSSLTTTTPAPSTASTPAPAPQMTYSQLVSTAYSVAKKFLSDQGVNLNTYIPTLLTSLETALKTGTAVVRFTGLSGTIEIQVNIYSRTAQYR